MTLVLALIYPCCRRCRWNFLFFSAENGEEENRGENGKNVGGACALWVSLLSLNCRISAGQVQEFNLTLSELPDWIMCE